MFRRRNLPLGIFSAHAWDALLTLFTAQVDDGRLTVAVVAERCGCSVLVMMRWLGFVKPTWQAGQGLVPMADEPEIESVASQPISPLQLVA
jgi:hypothetical protein